MEQPQIRLTRDDIEAGAATLEHLLNPKFTDDDPDAQRRRIVLEVVKAMNARRGGDPAGTIRRCEYRNGTCAVAVRVCGVDGALYWKITHPSGDVDESDGPLSNSWRLVTP